MSASLPRGFEVQDRYEVHADPEGLSRFLGVVYGMDRPNPGKFATAGSGPFLVLRVLVTEPTYDLEPSLSGEAVCESRLNLWKHRTRAAYGVREGVHATDAPREARRVWGWVRPTDHGVATVGPPTFSDRAGFEHVLREIWNGVLLRPWSTGADIDVLLPGDGKRFAYWLDPGSRLAARDRRVPEVRIGDDVVPIDIRGASEGYLPQELAQRILVDPTVDNLNEALLFKYLYHKQEASAKARERLEQSGVSLEPRPSWTLPTRVHDRTLVVRGDAHRALTRMERLRHHPRYRYRVLAGMADAVLDHLRRDRT